MKKIFITILCIFLIPVFVLAEGVQTAVSTMQNPLTVPQNINFEQCIKIYDMNQENLYYLTLASLSANRFNINEIQSSQGYILFSVNRNKYLAAIAKVDNTHSMIKITPCNNTYNFPPGILTNIYKYLDLNLSNEIKT